MPRITTVLEDFVKYRHGKKWKKRYCLISKPDSKKSSVTMFISKEFKADISSLTTSEKSKRQYIIDEITGFEHGRHVYKESHVMALIGCNIVHCIAFEQTDTMFRWAETLSKLLTSVNFHVTLKKFSETCNVLKNISSGMQGNLHVQSGRLCLIGEPADGNKFICDWKMENISALDIFDTKIDKIKKIRIKSIGRTIKGKGNFEFEISLTQSSLFQDTFSTFMKSCQKINPNFKCLHSLNTDGTPSQPIKVNNTNDCVIRATTENRSLEISIPKFREKIISNKRTIENVQTKMKESKENQKLNYDNQKHFSTIETISNHDNDSCLFPDDEDNKDEVITKSQSLCYSDKSQDSGGVYITGTSSSAKEADLFSYSPMHDNSDCVNSLQSSQHVHIKTNDHESSSFQKNRSFYSMYLTFYDNITRNPLSLNNYKSYCHLLKSMTSRRSRLTHRSNSFNCVYVSEIKRDKHCRKYSNTGFRLNLTSEAIEKHLTFYKNGISNERVNSVSLKIERELKSSKDALSDNKYLLHILPFVSLQDFHCSMMASIKSGNVCFNLFSYHHFLLLVKDAKFILKKIDSASTKKEADIEYVNAKVNMCRKNKVYNHWLERMESYCDMYETSDQFKETSVLDINMILIFDIIDTILYSRSFIPQGFNGTDFCNESLVSQTSLNEQALDKNGFNGKSPKSCNHQPFKERTACRESPSVLIWSASTPSFNNMQKKAKAPEKRDTKHSYQNLDPSDQFLTMNNTFPKQNISQNKKSTSIKGSLKSFGRKYSPALSVPFITRKLSPMDPTVTEPYFNKNNCETMPYYNLGDHKDSSVKRSLSMVMDSSLNDTESQRYINISTIPGTTMRNDSSTFVFTDLSLPDDDIYPPEIVDPSLNYDDMNFMKPRLFQRRHLSDIQNGLYAPRSQNSLQHSELSYSASLLNSSRSHKCNDYIDTLYPYKNLSPSNDSSPKSLNYVTVVTNQSCNKRPTSISKNFQEKLSSPIDYCEIDFNGTYALRDVDRKLYDKMHSRDSTINTSNNISAENKYSFRSLDQIPDNFSIYSTSGLREKKSLRCTKRYLTRFFSHDPTK